MISAATASRATLGASPFTITVVAQAGFAAGMVSLCLPSGGRFARVSSRPFHPRPDFVWRVVPMPAALALPTRLRSAAAPRAVARPCLLRVVRLPLELALPIALGAVGTLLERAARRTRASPRFDLAWAVLPTQAGVVEVEDCSGPRLAGEWLVQLSAEPLDLVWGPAAPWAASDLFPTDWLAWPRSGIWEFALWPAQWIALVLGRPARRTDPVFGRLARWPGPVFG